VSRTSDATESERLAREARREQRALQRRRARERRQLARAGERPLPRWRRERREAALEQIQADVESGRLVVRQLTAADLRALDEGRARRIGLPEPTPHELRRLVS
jgi:hypothetical protein